MQRLVQRAYVVVALVAIGGLFALPLVAPRPNTLAHIANRTQTAQVDDAWITDDGYPIPMSAEEAGIGPDDPAETAGMPGSLKDGPNDTGFYGYEGNELNYGSGYSYGDYYDTYDTYDSYDYYQPNYSYGSTGSYVSAGLSQVPIILSNSLSPQSYTTYSPTYVQQPIQTTYTYAQPQTYTYAQPTYQYQQSGIIAQPTVQANYQQYVQAPAQAGTYQQAVYTQQAAQITGTSYVAAPQTIAQPVQTTRAGFFAAGQPITQQTQVTVSSSGGSTAPAQPVASCWITAKPTRIAAGATTTLSWKVSNGSSATLTPTGIAVPLSGSTTAQLATTTTFTLAVSGDYGAATCTAKVTIDPTMCLPGCPPGYTCTPIVSAQTATTTKKSGFWSWLGF